MIETLQNHKHLYSNTKNMVKLKTYGYMKKVYITYVSLEIYDRNHSHIIQFS